ncbi:S1 family peptidase [Frankia sp. AgB32]|uniref:S1 family peptidase n=1 Tax=Frankia sp. AgB32 TaxID=631119 RepID=UPI00200D9773|nr:S1 family peptidase [Frankia sp. AgB32]MCK9895428.1 S1 family peptidase [Frankia sp. AgB32]
MAIAAALAGVLGTSTVAQAGSPGDPPHPALRAAPEILDSSGGLSTSLDQGLRRVAPNCYGGIEQTGDGELTVHVVDDPGCTPAATSAIARLTGSSSTAVKTVSATYSLRSLEAKRDTITKNRAALRSNGVSLRDWGVSISDNRLHVGLATVTPAATSRMGALVAGDSAPAARSNGLVAGNSGDPSIEVTQDASWVQTDRIVDSAPWYGGDRIVGPVGACTSGFSVFDNQHRTFNTTAGHCGYGTYLQGGHPYGRTINANYYDDGPTDAQIISTYPASAAGRIWTTQNGSNPVKGWINNQIGGNKVCANGSFSGEHCGGRINATDQCLYFDDAARTICHLDTVYSPGFQTVGGDSGGPVYNHAGVTADSGPDIYARGLVTGAYNGNKSLWVFTPMNIWTAQLGVTVLGG